MENLETPIYFFMVDWLTSEFVRDRSKNVGIHEAYRSFFPHLFKAQGEIITFESFCAFLGIDQRKAHFYTWGGVSLKSPTGSLEMNDGPENPVVEVAKESFQVQKEARILKEYWLSEGGAGSLASKEFKTDRELLNSKK